MILNYTEIYYENSYTLIGMKGPQTSKKIEKKFQTKSKGCKTGRLRVVMKKSASVPNVNQQGSDMD